MIQYKNCFYYLLRVPLRVKYWYKIKYVTKTKFHLKIMKVDEYFENQFKGPRSPP